jgi:ribonuclease P protein component
MPKQFTLGKEARLKSRKTIEQLFREGKSFNLPPFRVCYLLQDAPGSCLQFGTGAGSKNFKKAVDRNRIKRMTREAWRLQKTELQEELEKQNRGLAVFIIYTSKELPVYQAVHEKVGRILDKFLTIVVPKK